MTYKGAIAKSPVTPAKITECGPMAAGRVSVIIPLPLASVPAPPWLTPSMKTVPDWLGASRSNWKRKPVGPPIRIVEAEVVAPGAFVASGSPRAAKVATLPLVPPVSTQVALPTPAGPAKKAPRAPFPSAGAVQLPAQQTLRVSVSAREKPSASSAARPAGAGGNDRPVDEAPRHVHVTVAGIGAGFHADSSH